MMSRWYLAKFAYLCVKCSRDKCEMARLMWRMWQLPDDELYRLAGHLEAGLGQMARERHKRK